MTIHKIELRIIFLTIISLLFYILFFSTVGPYTIFLPLARNYGSQLLPILIVLLLFFQGRLTISRKYRSHHSLLSCISLFCALFAYRVFCFLPTEILALSGLLLALSVFEYFVSMIVRVYQIHDF
jgi:hypothetical protein